MIVDKRNKKILFIDGNGFHYYNERRLLCHTEMELDQWVWVQGQVVQQAIAPVTLHRGI
jgi:hypothetical protein